MGIYFGHKGDSDDYRETTRSFDMECAVNAASRQLSDLPFRCFDSSCPVMISFPRRKVHGFKHAHTWRVKLTEEYDREAEELITRRVKEVLDSAPFDVSLQREIRENEIVIRLDSASVRRGRDHFLQCAQEFKEQIYSRHAGTIDRLARAVLKHETIGSAYKSPFDYDLDSESIAYSGAGESYGYAPIERLYYSELGLNNLRHFHQWFGLACAISSRMSELNPGLGKASSIGFRYDDCTPSLQVRYAVEREKLLEEW